MPLPILQLGDPILHRSATAVVDPLAPDIQQWVDRLLETAIASHGIGIAAPQVGVSQQIIIVASRPNPRYPTAPIMEPMAMINPHLVAVDQTQVKGWEGCLSVPNQRALVPRAVAVEVEYLDRWGRSQRQVFRDFVARIIQHEIDHLGGRVFLDRVMPEDEIIDEVSFLQRVQSVAHKPTATLQRIGD